MTPEELRAILDRLEIPTTYAAKVLGGGWYGRHQTGQEHPESTHVYRV